MLKVVIVDSNEKTIDLRDMSVPEKLNPETGKIFRRTHIPMLDKPEKCVSVLP